MTDDQLKSNKKFFGEKKASMKRRDDRHDYSERRMYMVTLEVEGRLPVFGSLVGDVSAERGSIDYPRIELTALGRAVQSEWLGIDHYFPQIQVMAVQMMPDHMHGILFVKEPLPVHLGQVISGFKAGCRRALKALANKENAFVAAKPLLTEKAEAKEQLPIEKEKAPQEAAKRKESQEAAKRKESQQEAKQEAKKAPQEAAKRRESQEAKAQEQFSASKNGPTMEKGRTNSPQVTVLPSHKNLAHKNLAQKAPSQKAPSQKNSAQPFSALTPQASIPQPSSAIFAKGYNDLILRSFDELAKWKNYLLDNPRRLMMKRACPEWLRPFFNLKIGPYTFSGIGNRNLLSAPKRVAVRVSRRLSESEIAAETARYLESARQGTVLVSPSISPGEKRVMRTAFDAGLPTIVIMENGFTPLSKPRGESFDACAQGRLLMLSPWEHHNNKKKLTADQCRQMNLMALEICTQ